MIQEFHIDDIDEIRIYRSDSGNTHLVLHLGCHQVHTITIPQGEVLEYISQRLMLFSLSDNIDLSEQLDIAF